MHSLRSAIHPCAQDEEGVNALMRAAENGKDEVVGLLLEAGVPWNAVDRRGRCAGDFALSAGHEAATMRLVDAGTLHCCGT